MLSKIGMINSADAAQYLISSMKGYQISAKDSVTIVDKLTSVDMEAAVSAGELAEAMSKTANLARVSGVSMDNLIGIFRKSRKYAKVGKCSRHKFSVDLFTYGKY